MNDNTFAHRNVHVELLYAEYCIDLYRGQMPSCVCRWGSPLCGSLQLRLLRGSRQYFPVEQTTITFFAWEVISITS